jgi:hypothetical protein
MGTPRTVLRTALSLAPRTARSPLAAKITAARSGGAKRQAHGNAMTNNKQGSSLADEMIG